MLDCSVHVFFDFFFQAEDGIRDLTVTGVQTCALPISSSHRCSWGRAVAEQRCELVTVIGDAGMGKSRLAAEALASIEARVVRGRCLPYGDRKSVVWGKSVDLGGRRIIKKKKKKRVGAM